MKNFILFILICFLIADFNLALDRKKNCKCRILPDKRIIGGRIANSMAYPWMVSISYQDKGFVTEKDRKSKSEQFKLSHHSCGGVILNEWWILTAGHCIPSENFLNQKRIGLGTNDLVKMFDDKMYIEIEDAFTHPSFYAEKVITHDIGLIKLKTPIKFTNLIGPACLGFDEEDTYEGQLKISGWGSINKVVYSSDDKKKMVPVVSRYLKEAINYDITNEAKICQKGNAWQFICIGNKETKESACKGDSGGPLHSPEKLGKTKVIGLTSFGDMERGNKTITVCTGKETAYTRLFAFRAFIEENVGQDYC